MRWFLCFGGLTNNIIYRSMSITTSEGCPYNISIVGVDPIDIHRRVVHIKYQSLESTQLIYIGGLSMVKNKYLCLEMVFIHGRMHV